MSETTTLAALRQQPVQPPQRYAVALTDSQGFELAQRAAKLLAASQLVPKEYQGNLPNCVIALNMAQRVGADPLQVMQNLVIVHGRPTWSSQFMIASVNTCGRFSALRYEFFGERGTDGWGCRAWAIEKATGEKLMGTDITIAIAKKEGWFGRNGSKWQSIPQQMLMYRAGAWWARAYAPELSMGLQTSEEIADVIDVNPDGTVTGITTETLRARAVRTDAEVVQPEQQSTAAPAQTVTDQVTGELKSAPEQAQPATSKPPLPYDVVADAIVTAGTSAQLERADALIERAPQERQDELTALSAKQRELIAAAQQRDLAEANEQQHATSPRRGRSGTTDGLNLE